LIRPSTEPEIEVLSLRLSNQGPRLGKSLVLKVKLEDIDAGECQWLGWERNERAKLGPRLANLSNSMDPKKYVDLAGVLSIAFFTAF
jgi:Ubiquitin-like modifier-activating enzyme ATG7 N-terminus